MKRFRLSIITIMAVLSMTLPVFADSASDKFVMDEEICVTTSGDGQEKDIAGESTITYHLNGGVNNSANPTSYVPGKKTALKPAAREGYKFAGWYVDKELNNKIKSISAMASGNIDLYAKWKPKSYSIKYVIKTGLVKRVKKNKLNPKKYTPDTGINEFYAPMAEGFSFRGWYKDPEYTTPCETISANTIGKLKLFAKWTEGPLTINFDLNGAEGEAPTAIQCDSAQKVSLPLPSVSKIGCRFYGWNTKADGSGNKYIGEIQGLYSTNADNSLKLYAQWIENDKVQEAMAKEIFDQVNEVRETAGLAPLNHHSALMVAANVRAEELSIVQDHVRPSGKGGLTAIEEAGYKGSSFAENIAWGYADSKSVMKAWLDSKQGHRENILSTTYTDIGIGCYEKDGTWYYVQCFGKQ